MKHILLFGAGKSATVLIDYLKRTATEKNWLITIADANLAAAQLKAGDHPLVKAAGVPIENEPERRALVERADVVISLLPPSLHYIVALDCVAFGKHLLTASYVDEKLKMLAEDIKKKRILFLCEMGLDPGIDHMSAMELIHRIREQGGRIHSFLSHCGGLVAPESDDNPWHYKISWNPRNVVLAGKAGAVYRERSKVKSEKYDTMFMNCDEVSVKNVGQLAWYPNRDSLGYIPLYGMEETETFIRTTLRYPDFCKGWKYIVEAGLTDETTLIDTNELSVASFFRNAFAKHGMKLAEDSKGQFVFLGWNDETIIGKGSRSPADILQDILEQKWVLQEHDKDMVVMLHQVGYSLDGKDHSVTSELVVKGMDNLHTAMAKTVGLPLGIAATLLLENKIAERGLHIPTVPGIYRPVLEVLKDYGISFMEEMV